MEARSRRTAQASGHQGEKSVDYEFSSFSLNEMLARSAPGLSPSAKWNYPTQRALVAGRDTSEV